jgi:hypothetical protein
MPAIFIAWGKLRNERRPMQYMIIKKEQSLSLKKKIAIGLHLYGIKNKDRSVFFKWRKTFPPELGKLARTSVRAVRLAYDTLLKF